MNTQSAFEYLTGKRTFDSSEAAALSRQGAEEGIVLLENNGMLPLSKGDGAVFFGRMQKHYLILGTGSGGRVNPPFTTEIFSSLAGLGLVFDREVEAFYDDFVEKNPYDYAGGWSNPPSQKEPELDSEFVKNAAKRAKNALVVITRTAGEDCDLPFRRGGYMLTETERDNLALIREHFERVCVLLNTCGIIDMSEIYAAQPDAVLMLWQGGMMGGEAAARVIMGNVNPSGRLPDTVAASREDYPAYGNFGAAGRNFYKEDIFVGYRYFNTFAEDKILYPFGYGLSYTEFEYCILDLHRRDGRTRVRVAVTNCGKRAGKDVVQCYVKAPCGRLGKPDVVLAAFQKTPVLYPGETYTADLSFSDYSIASYDDSSYCYLLEAGEYTVLIGKDSMSLYEDFCFNIDEDTVIKRCESALAPLLPFERLVNRDGEPVYESVPLRQYADEPVPPTLGRIEKDGRTLDDVASGVITAEELVARMSDEDLIHMVRAEGMSSPKVTPGTAAAFCGITPSLRALGLPALCCTDGPSGIRMVSDEKCIAYPAATCIAATWNTELAEEMYVLCGCELASYCVDILLGPGTNIHRDPLCGRNFEYFSEDPLLSGKMAAAICRGLDRAGVSGAVKHFLANNQECDRHGADSVISERAVREIYARPFEICVAESPVRSVMTSYNPVNGRWAASNYDLTVRLLRNDFGFDGFVMTDWWAKVSGEDGSASTENLAAMVHAMNDIYMVSPDAIDRVDNLPASLANGSLTLGELQACAVNLVRFAKDSLSYAALKVGYGVRDLKAECDGREPEVSLEVSDGRATVISERACKATVRIGLVSTTPALTQTNVNMHINTKNAGGFLIGGTEGSIVYDYREVSLVEGENNFAFTSESDKAYAVSVEVF